ncbi:MAG: type 4a pilus biogenesis protein PilO [Proteobacteria bacterium]|nr:type 4a pilus biogenesis protein PilO [Pseudomonadota bacterium]
MIVRVAKGGAVSLSPRNMIAILATIVILLGVFFVTWLYYPTNKRAKRIANSRAILEAQVEALSPMVGGAEGVAEITEIMSGEVNFFKRRNLSPSKGIPELLEEISTIGRQAKIQFVAIKPVEEKDDPSYREYPILIEAKASYSELVNFVHQMENLLQLSLRDFRIENEEKDPLIHRLHFTLNIVELKQDHPAVKGNSGERHVPRPVDTDLVAVHRDPFSQEEESPVVQVLGKPGNEKASRRSGRPKLVLTGILDVGEGGFVIINGKILKVGETIEGQRIQQIGNNHVIILDESEENTTYALYLEGSSPFELLEVKP